MILYVNGDSHSAAGEAVNSYCFAEDDPLYRKLGRKPHPANLEVSYGNILADILNYELVCHAESGSSNNRIIRTTKEYLSNGNTPDLIVIGWATWEREEFLIDGDYYQFSGGVCGNDWPGSIKELYQTWVINALLHKRASFWHNQIYEFHLELMDKNVNHLFFNSYHAFNHDFCNNVEWQNTYIEPYSHDQTFYYWLSNQGFKTVNPKSYHYGKDAHQAWAKHLTNILKESTMIK